MADPVELSEAKQLCFENESRLMRYREVSRLMGRLVYNIRRIVIKAWTVQNKKEPLIHRQVISSKFPKNIGISESEYRISEYRKS